MWMACTGEKQKHSGWMWSQRHVHLQKTVEVEAKRECEPDVIGRVEKQRRRVVALMISAQGEYTTLHSRERPADAESHPQHRHQEKKRRLSGFSGREQRAADQESAQGITLFFILPVAVPPRKCAYPD
jgi:hypothetical protein